MSWINILDFSDEELNKYNSAELRFLLLKDYIFCKQYHSETFLNENIKNNKLVSIIALYSVLCDMDNIKIDVNDLLNIFNNIYEFYKSFNIELKLKDFSTGIGLVLENDIVTNDNNIKYPHIKWVKSNNIPYKLVDNFINKSDNTIIKLLCEHDTVYIKTYFVSDNYTQITKLIKLLYLFKESNIKRKFYIEGWKDDLKKDFYSFLEMYMKNYSLYNEFLYFFYKKKLNELFEFHNIYQIDFLKNIKNKITNI